ncbi:hypothetical protein XA68_16023 [Ophiocordyceps unilateralis]|uniref:Uncharacterized protein n=1 Tax=Ophiocordyceps unilateralis TaxID=268505 RepID=A0A2A9P5J6_OPHUN|nr:hypothetical protein XA68_16023 [Ophiocordyceps unilateralis]
MRAAAALLQLTLCVSTATAFFPYQPGWRKEKQAARSGDGLAFALKAANIPSDGPLGGATRMPRTTATRSRRP